MSVLFNIYLARSRSVCILDHGYLINSAGLFHIRACIICWPWGKCVFFMIFVVCWHFIQAFFHIGECLFLLLLRKICLFHDICCTLCGDKCILVRGMLKSFIYVHNLLVVCFSGGIRGQVKHLSRPEWCSPIWTWQCIKPFKIFIIKQHYWF